MAWFDYYQKYKTGMADQNPFATIKAGRAKLAEKTGEAEIDVAKQGAIEEGKNKQQITMEGVKSRYKRGEEAQRERGHERITQIGADERLGAAKINAGSRERMATDANANHLEVAKIGAASRSKVDSGGYDKPEEIPTNVGGLPLKSVKMDAKTGKHIPEYGYMSKDEEMMANAPPPVPRRGIIGGIKDFFMGSGQDGASKPGAVGNALKRSQGTALSDQEPPPGQLDYKVGSLYKINGVDHRVASVDEKGEPTFEPVSTGKPQKRY